MNSKKWMIGAAVLAVSASLAIAAPHGEWGGHGKGRGMFGEKFAQKLNLTDAQKQQVRDLNKSFRQDNEAFFKSFRQTMQDYRAAKEANDTAKLGALKSTVESQRAQMKQLRDAQEQKILPILTPDQRAQYQALKAEAAARHQKRSQQ
jgi:periplasmic protein CpxP/Spy